MRRIVLDNSEIVSKEFFEGLAGLDFTKQNGLWIPPSGVAVGTVSAPTLQDVLATDGALFPTAEDDDLVVQIHLLRPDGRLIFVVGAPIRSPMTWFALPDGEILLRSGRTLVGFNFAANIREPAQP